KKNQQKSKPANPQAAPKKSATDIAILIGFFAIPALLVFWVAQRSPMIPRSSGTPAATTASSTPPPGTQAVLKPAALLLQSNLPTTATTAAAPPPAPSIPASVTSPPVTAAAVPIEPVKDVRQLVTSLSEVDISAGSISQE